MGQERTRAVRHRLGGTREHSPVLLQHRRYGNARGIAPWAAQRSNIRQLVLLQASVRRGR